MAVGFTVQVGPHTGRFDYSSRIDYRSLRIFQSIRHQGGQASFEVTIYNKDVLRPKTFNEVVVIDNNTGDRIFGGVVQRVTQVDEAPTVKTYMVQCGDYTRWLDHIPAGIASYPDGRFTGDASTEGIPHAIVEIIQDWVTQSTGTTALGDPAPAVPLNVHFTAPVFNNVGVMTDPGGGYISLDSIVSIAGYVPNYISVSQAIEYLAKLSNAVWRIDPDGYVWFINPTNTLLLGPLSYTQDITYSNQYPLGPTVLTENMPTIQADTDTDTYWDLKITEDTSSTISAVTVKDYYAVTTSPVLEDKNTFISLTGDGTTHFFKLYNKPVDKKHTVVVVGAKTYSNPAGVPATASPGSNMGDEYQDGQPGDGAVADVCYVCPSNQGIRFVVPPPAGANIQVTYHFYTGPTQDRLAASQLAALIAAREGFGPGYYYSAISDEALTTPISVLEGLTAWQAEMILQLTRYGRVKILAEFGTRIKGWKPGAVFGIYSPNRGDNAAVNFTDSMFTGWRTAFEQKFFVTQISMEVENNYNIKYSIEAASDIWGE